MRLYETLAGGGLGSNCNINKLINLKMDIFLRLQQIHIILHYELRNKVVAADPVKNLIIVPHFNKLATVALGSNLKPFESVNITCPSCVPSDKVITAVSAVTLPGLPL